MLLRRDHSSLPLEKMQGEFSNLVSDLAAICAMPNKKHTKQTYLRHVIVHLDEQDKSLFASMGINGQALSF